MDPVAIGAIVTAVCGGAATVIGALAILWKVRRNPALVALRSLWDWVEFHDLQDQVPARIRRAVISLLDGGPDEAHRDDS